MRTYILQVQGGQEMKTAYMIDLFMMEENIKTIYLSSFEREKFQYMNENFKKGAVGYVLMLSLYEIDKNMWYRVREYLNEMGLYVSWPKEFDPQDMMFGPFLNAVIEKINDFIDKMNQRIFSAYLSMKKSKLRGMISYVHIVLGISQEHAYDTYARWVSYVTRPVSVIDTG